MLTDGMDTRPYRLNWPKSTMIFDVSPDSIFHAAAEKLEGIETLTNLMIFTQDMFLKTWV